MIYTIILGIGLMALSLSTVLSSKDKNPTASNNYGLIRSLRAFIGGLIILTFGIAFYTKKYFPGFAGQWFGIVWALIAITFVASTLFVALSKKPNRLIQKLTPSGKNAKEGEKILCVTLAFGAVTSFIFAYLFYYLFTWM